MRAILLAALLVAASARAQVGEWVDVGPRGGAAWIVAVDGTDPDVAYAAVGWDVWKTSDGGREWTVTPPLLSRGSETSVVGLVTVGATLYVAIASFDVDVSDCWKYGYCTHRYVVAKSTDGGLSWATLLENVVAGYPPPPQPSHPGRFLTVRPGPPDTIYAQAHDRLIESVDGGATWTDAGAGLPSAQLTALVVDPDDASVVYAASRVDEDEGGVGGIWKSTDRGATFVPAMVGLDTPNAVDVRAMVLAPTQPRRIWIGTAAGVFTSTDGAASWQPAAAGVPTPVTALSFGPTKPATVYAGGEGGIFRSTDGGGSWTAVADPLRVRGSELAILALAVAPGNSDVIYAGTDVMCAVSTRDRGDTWTSNLRGGCATVTVSDLAVTPASPAVLLTANFEPYIWRSSDDSRTWSARHVGIAVGRLAIAPSDPALVYAVGEGVARSRDGGDHWEVRKASPFPLASEVVVDPRDPDTLHTVSLGGDVKTSTDGGATWVPILVPGLFFSLLTVDPIAPDTWYGKNDLQHIVKTVDGGLHWDFGHRQFEVEVFFTLDPREPTRLYAFDPTGGFISTDGATTWNPLETPKKFFSVAVDPVTSNLYAEDVDSSGQYYVAPPGGATWSTLGAPTSSGDLRIDPLGRALYVYHSGVRRLSLAPCGPEGDGPGCQRSIRHARATVRRAKGGSRIAVRGRLDTRAPFASVNGASGLVLGLAPATGPSRVAVWNAGECKAEGSVGLRCTRKGATLRLKAATRPRGVLALRAAVVTADTERPPGPFTLFVSEPASLVDRVARLERCGGSRKRTTCRQ